MDGPINPEEAALLEEVRSARAAKCTVAGNRFHLDASLAYRIQEHLGAHRPVRGYKLGLVSPAKQAQMGITTPIYGRIYDDMLLEQPVVSLSRFIQPRFEPEIVILLGEDLSPTAAIHQAQQAIAMAYLGIDLLDSIWAGYRFTLAEVIADNASGGGFLRGKKPLAWPAVGTLRLFIDEHAVAEGSLEALGPVEDHLLWLAHEVGGLKAGQLIYLGSPISAQPARPGSVRVEGPQGSWLAITFLS
ncbi:hypothetical protein A4R35_01270 [Thermogemmatispora tikiterensis]|uniref:Fumarylacetoacetase-like C-terminal domain-containing protein n=2 Tax=Thermogemmatispora tikiterensis TaxID=1825093 RepID=A0A328VF25_9CHLR|nr:hypothetical protein A4R35_01270 [Thermogemmatispora tikiterensis]